MSVATRIAAMELIDDATGLGKHCPSCGPGGDAEQCHQCKNKELSDKTAALYKPTVTKADMLSNLVSATRYQLNTCSGEED